jgi:hypothetical protein
MSINRLAIGPCPQCQAELVCSYNYFERDSLTIESWEHKCANCGFRETKAYRSDQPPPDGESVDPKLCPFCQRRPV